MTKQRILDDFTYIADLLDDLEWGAEIVGEETPYPTLVAVLPLEEDYEETLVFNYIELPKEDVEYSKLLQCYCHIPLELSEIPDGELMVLVNQINLLTTVGHFIYHPAEKKSGHYISLRYVWTLPEDQLPDDGVIGEVVLMILHYCQIMEGLLIRRLEGTPMAELLTEVKLSLKQ